MTRQAGKVKLHHGTTSVPKKPEFLQRKPLVELPSSRISKSEREATLKEYSGACASGEHKYPERANINVIQMNPTDPNSPLIALCEHHTSRWELRLGRAMMDAIRKSQPASPKNSRKRFVGTAQPNAVELPHEEIVKEFASFIGQAGPGGQNVLPAAAFDAALAASASDLVQLNENSLALPQIKLTPGAKAAFESFIQWREDPGSPNGEFFIPDISGIEFLRLAAEKWGAHGINLKMKAFGSGGAKGVHVAAAKAPGPEASERAATDAADAYKQELSEVSEGKRAYAETTIPEGITLEKLRSILAPSINKSRVEIIFEPHGPKGPHDVYAGRKDGMPAVLPEIIRTEAGVQTAQPDAGQ